MNICKKCVYMYLSNAKDQAVTDSVNLLNAKYASAMSPTCMQIHITFHNFYMSAQTFIHMQHPNDSISCFHPYTSISNHAYAI